MYNLKYPGAIIVLSFIHQAFLINPVYIKIIIKMMLEALEKNFFITLRTKLNNNVNIKRKSLQV